MVFSDNLFDMLPDDLTEAVSIICRQFFEYEEMARAAVSMNDELADYYESLIDAYAGLEAFILSNGIGFPIPELTTNRQDNIRKIRDFFYNVHNQNLAIVSENTLNSARYKYKAKMGQVFGYEFTEGDINRLQGLINELRDQITANPVFSEDHRRRLLARLEKLQAELHKKMSNLDRFWGLVGEAGIVLGKFGTDVKPIIDRIREVADIVWRTQSISEGLPTGMPRPTLAENINDREKNPDEGLA